MVDDRFPERRYTVIKEGKLEPIVVDQTKWRPTWVDIIQALGVVVAMAAIIVITILLWR